MNAANFADWLQRRGVGVLRTPSSYWHIQGPRSYQAFPYHWLINPTNGEVARLLRASGALCLRYSTDLAAPAGMLSYHAVYEKPTYDLDRLGKWARKNVRRGLRACTVEQISPCVVGEEGWLLQRDTLDRQNRALRLAREDWRICWRAAAEIAGFEAWGAFVQNRLAASVVTFQMDDCCYLLFQQCHRDFLTSHVNNALSFIVTQTMMARSGVRSILYGLHSLDAEPSVDEFKFRMGYSAKPVRQRVAFHPVVAPLINAWSHKMLRWAKQVRPQSSFLAKAEGVVRFYREGKRPLDLQPVPPALRQETYDEC